MPNMWARCFECYVRDALNGHVWQGLVASLSITRAVFAVAGSGGGGRPMLPQILWMVRTGMRGFLFEDFEEVPEVRVDSLDAMALSSQHSQFDLKLA